MASNTVDVFIDPIEYIRDFEKCHRREFGLVITVQKPSCRKRLFQWPGHDIFDLLSITLTNEVSSIKYKLPVVLCVA